MKTSTQRQAAYRARMREQGFVQILIWIRPEWRKAVDSLLAKLRGTYQVAEGACPADER